MSDMIIVSGIIIFLSVLIVFNMLLPSDMQFISILNLVVFALSTVGVAGFCIIATGIPCAIALGVSVGASFAIPTVLEALGMTFSSSGLLSSYISSLILTPIQFIMTIFIARLARGNG